jgi:hypothetical protein
MFPSAFVAGVVPERLLLITMTVGGERRDLSGLGTVAATLVSPNVDLFPS